MSTVELHAAHVFDCDECGRENFVRAVEGDMNESVMEALTESDDEAGVEMLAMEADMVSDGDYVRSPCLISRISVVPAKVKCQFCGVEFKTEVPTVG